MTDLHWETVTPLMRQVMKTVGGGHKPSLVESVMTETEEGGCMEVNANKRKRTTLAIPPYVKISTTGGMQYV